MSQNYNALHSVQMAERGEKKITTETTEAAAGLNCNVQQEGRVKFTELSPVSIISSVLYSKSN